MLSQRPGKTPDFVKGVVERGGGDSDDVGFAKIAFHIGRLEFAEEFFWVFMCQDRQLATARVGITRCDNSKFFRSNFR